MHRSAAPLILSIVALSAVGPSCTPAPDNEAPSQAVIVSSLERFMPGLNEHVQLELLKVGSRTWKRAVRADGRIERAGHVFQQERRAYAARFGAMDYQLWKRFDTAPADARRVVVAYHEDLITPDGLTQSLHTNGAIDIHDGKPLPFVIATMSAPLAKQVAFWPEVSRIGSATVPADGETHEFVPPANTEAGNSLKTPLIDPEMTGTYTGADQNIGIVEQGACRLLSEHDHVGTVIEEDLSAVTSCQTDLGCDHCGDTFECINFTCVDTHASRILSAMAHVFPDEGGERAYGAYDARFYHPTVGNGGDINCDEDGILRAYQWLNENGVTTVTESFGCEAEDGMTQDFYARHEDMAIFRASGNFSEEETTEAPCRPMNSTCVGGTEPDGSGGFTIWSDSTYLNPTTTNGDREEPDIVSLAKDVELIEMAQLSEGPLNPSDTWGLVDGTSFAAPAMASLGALTKEACGGNLNHNYLRAMMMVAAWDMNPFGSLYSTPGLGTDERDGAGTPMADNLVFICNYEPGSGPIAIGGGQFTVNVTGDGEEDAPPWIEGTPGGYPGWSPEGFGPPTAQPLGDYPGGAKMKHKQTYVLEVSEGDRVRISMAWDNCPSADKGTGPSGLAADFDLFACDYEAEDCLAASRSYDNNNEGFDFIVPQQGEIAVNRALSIEVGYDPDASAPCDPSNLESFWLVYAHGPPDSFP